MTPQGLQRQGTLRNQRGWQECSAQETSDTFSLTPGEGSFPFAVLLSPWMFFTPHSKAPDFQSKGPSQAIHSHTLMFVCLFFFKSPHLPQKKAVLMGTLTTAWPNVTSLELNKA